jgi:hypothetical protein
MKRFAFLAVVACLCSCALTGTGRAGSITYTFEHYAGRADILSGSFSVPTSVLAAGKVTASDITSWSFTTPDGHTFDSTTSSLFIPPPTIDIDKTTGGFTTFGDLAFFLTANSYTLDITADTHWNKPNGEVWIEKDFRLHRRGMGNGHWQITIPSTTPEPSSLTLVGIGAVGLLGYGWRRRKQAVA